MDTGAASAPAGSPAASEPATPAAKKPGETLAIIGLFIAFSVVPSPVGLIISIIAYWRSHREGYKNKIALAGIIVNIVFLLVFISLFAQG